jgi:hypothetical protein
MIRRFAWMIALGALIACGSPAAPSLEQEVAVDGPVDVTGVALVLGGDTIQLDWMRCDFPKNVVAAPDSAFQP